MPHVSILSLLLLCLSAWSGETYHVAISHPQADDAGPGSAEKPWRGLSASVAKLKPGDTLLVHGGLYRELVALSVSGAEGQPITIRAAPGERAVVLGSQRLTGWKRCVAGEAEGNPQADKLWVIDLPEVPPRLIGDPLRRQEYRIATLPSEGRWQMAGAEGLRRFTDAKNLTGTTPDAYAGWSLYTFYQAGGGGRARDDFTYDPAAHAITLGSDFTQYAKAIDPERDGYWFENHPRGIDGPGRFAWRKQGEGVRLWVWPHALEGDQPLIETVVHQQPFATEREGAAWLIIDGLELRFSGHGRRNEPIRLRDSEIRNCLWFDIGYIACRLNSSERVRIRNNLFRHCGYGISMAKSRDIVVERNEIGWCRVDGCNVTWGSSRVRIVGNLIRNNFAYMHPDGIQTFEGVEDIEIRDNAILNCGQLMIIANVKRGITVENNILYGWEASAMRTSSDSGVPMRRYSPRDPKAGEILKAFAAAPADDYRFARNTVVGGDYGPFDWNAKTMEVRDNVIAPLTQRMGPGFYVLRNAATSTADRNLLSPPTGFQGNLASIGSLQSGPDGGLAYHAAKPMTIAELRDKHGLERNGLVAEAQFINAPRHTAFGDSNKVADHTRDRLILEKRSQSSFAVGDTIELANDSVARRVTAIEPWGEQHCALSFTPPMPRLYVRSVLVANWKDAKDLILDLRLRDGSPGKGAASDGKDLGSSIDLPAYLRGDFDGDGKRDIPAEPCE